MDSSKRSLYKPAPVNNVGAQASRRALTQGRLVNDAVLPESMTVYASPSNASTNADTITTISHHPDRFSEGSLTSAHQLLASLRSPGSTQPPSLTSTQSSPAHAHTRSPTHHRPMVDTNVGYTPPRSPSKPSPSNFLDLSDSDREYVSHHSIPIRHIPATPGSPVMLVDATALRRGQGQAEVEVTTSSVSSPAKVICHAPSIAADEDLRNTGYTEEAARVHMDTVPTVTMLSDADLAERASAQLTGPVERGFPKQALVGETSTPQESAAPYGREMDGDSSVSTLKPGEQMSVDIESLSLKGEEDLSNHSEHPSSAMSMDGSKGATTKKKKKVKGKFVQSRYMQSLSKPAAAHTSNVSAADSRTVNTSSAAGKSTASSKVHGSSRPASGSVRHTEKAKSSSQRNAPVRATKTYGPPPSTTTNTTTAPPSNHQSRANRTPSSSRAHSTSHAPPTSHTHSTSRAHSTSHAPPTSHAPSASQYSTPVGKVKGKRFASTPAVNASLLQNASTAGGSVSILGANMSAIAPVDSSRLGGRDYSTSNKSRRERVTSSELTGDSSVGVISHDQDSAYSSLGIKHSSQLTQENIHVMYARYLQAFFLDTKMKKTLEDKENNAMSDMHSMWEVNEELRQKKAKLELKLARLKHANILDAQLEIQEQGLGPIIAHLPKFQKEYSTMAHALDTTRHQVQLTDILLPADQDAFHESLERALGESEQLLGEIGHVTGSKQPKVSAFSSAIAMLESAVASESEELKRCQELLAATSSLSAHDISLRIQQIEEEAAR